MTRPQIDAPRLEYQPLRNNEIRLLRIHPLSASPKDRWKSWTVPIGCDLEHYPLVEPGLAEDLSNRLAKPGAVWDSSTPTLGVAISPSTKTRVSKRRKFKELFTRRPPDVRGRFAWGDYVALSYTWGKEDATEEIIVNGVLVKIRPNLESALRALRDKAPIRAGMKIWIDALCINQDDTDERNAQVPRMREIYQRAFNVVIWLGPETDTSTSALSLVRILAASWDEDEGKTLAKTIGENPYFWQTHIKHDAVSLRNCWQGLQSLILADYWKRVWIVQEVAMGGRSSPLLQGDACVEFGQVCDAAAKWMIRYARVASTAMLNDCMSDPAFRRRMDELQNFRDTFEPTQENVPELVSRYVQMMNDIKAITDTQNSEQWAFHIDRITFVESLAVRLAGATTMTSPPGNLVALGRSSEATQAQDKIFAFLSLMDPDFAQKFKVDYSLSAREVYTDFSIKWIQHSKSLDLFVHCLIEHNHHPSWVPDWTFNTDMPSMYIGEFHDNYRAGGLRTLLDVNFSDDGTKLHTLGMFADTIDGLSTADDEPAARIRNGSATPTGSFTDTRRALFMTLVAGRERKDADSSAPQDPDGPSFLDVPLPRTHSAALPEPYQRAIYKFIDTNAGFLVNGRPLEAYFANGGARVDVSRDARPEISSRVDMHLQAFAASLLLHRRRLATTKLGALALVPRATEPGDLVAVLVGCGQPVVLRPGEGGFRVVGTAYVHGVMEGEMMTEENVVGLGVEICLM